eukprot:15365210-Ditylum_brightwellii.AAC.1
MPMKIPSAKIAVEEAIWLTRIASEVVAVSTGPAPKCYGRLWDAIVSYIYWKKVVEKEEPDLVVLAEARVLMGIVVRYTHAQDGLAVCI